MARRTEEHARFRHDLQVFLGEKMITGIGFDLDPTTRVLTAASAVIPIFGFPDWEWDQISEVLVYPDRFDQNFAFHVHLTPLASSKPAGFLWPPQMTSPPAR